MKTPFDDFANTVSAKAQAIILDRSQWHNGETVLLRKGPLFGKRSKIYLKNQGGGIFLVVFLDATGKYRLKDRRSFVSDQPLAILDPTRGWVPFSEADASNREWLSKALQQAFKGAG